MRKKSFISVVVPSYKSAATLPRLLGSILYEGSLVDEVIVVEDGVFDNTDEVLKNYSNVKHLCLKVNAGAANARNQGLKLVTNEYVMFIDADDYVRPGLVEGLLAAIDDSSSDVALGPCLSYWPGTGKKRLYRPPLDDEKIEYHLALRWLKGDSGPGTCSILWRKTSIERIGAWDSKLVRNQDGELAIRASLYGLSFVISQKSYSVYVRSNGVSISNDISDSALNSLLYVGEKVRRYIETEKLPDFLTQSLKCYWARSALLAYKNKKYNHANKFHRMAGFSGYIKMNSPSMYKFFILAFGPRYASLLWDWLINRKRQAAVLVSKSRSDYL